MNPPAATPFFVAGMGQAADEAVVNMPARLVLPRNAAGGKSSLAAGRLTRADPVGECGSSADRARCPVFRAKRLTKLRGIRIFTLCGQFGRQDSGSRRPPGEAEALVATEAPILTDRSPFPDNIAIKPPHLQEENMITLTDNARRELEAYFAGPGKAKSPIRIYLASGG